MLHVSIGHAHISTSMINWVWLSTCN